MRDSVVSAFIFDTSVLSPLLDPSHSRHSEVRAVIRALDSDSTQFVSTVSLAELDFGVRLSEIHTGSSSDTLEQMLRKAYGHAVLEITKHTASAYAELKAKLAGRYLTKVVRNSRPRWVEDWKDRATGQKLQIDENDLWICAQAKERSLVLVTADRRMKRIQDADSEVRLLAV